MINSDSDIEEINANLQSWKVISYDSRSIEVALKFVEPLKVSSGENPDMLLVQIGLSNIPDKNGQTLPPSVLKKVLIPAQFSSEEEAKVI